MVSSPFKMSGEVEAAETVRPRIALALSGGGFRASIFQLGVLKRLAELGWLQRVDALSTVSGGSIIGAFAVIHWQEWLQAGGDAAAFNRIIVQPFLRQIQKRNFLLEWLLRSQSWPLRKLFSPIHPNPERR